jgi:iron complex outermembrane receptor protein
MLPPFYSQIDNIQFSAICGDLNNAAQINADKGTGYGYGYGYGFEIDAQYLVSNNLTVTAE